MWVVQLKENTDLCIPEYLGIGYLVEFLLLKATPGTEIYCSPLYPLEVEIFHQTDVPYSDVPYLKNIVPVSMPNKDTLILGHALKICHIY